MSDGGGALPEAPGRRRRAVLPWHVRLFDIVSTYLPVLLMGLLALGTWWLVKNTPATPDEQVAAPPRHEPDYAMTQFGVQRYGPDGALEVVVEGERLRHYPDTDTLEIDAPRIRAVAADGRVTRATALRALSNGDASEVQLIGAAQVIREAGADGAAIEFRGEFLHAFLNTERVRSHLPVVVVRGGTEIRAQGLQYDNLSKVIELQGRMRAVFAPPPRRPAKAPR